MAGRCIEQRVMHNRGGPDNPLSEDDLRTKFRLNAEQLLPRDRAERLPEAISRLQEASTVETLVDLTQPPP